MGIPSLTLAKCVTTGIRSPATAVLVRAMRSSPIGSALLRELLVIAPMDLRDLHVMYARQDILGHRVLLVLVAR